MENKIRKRVSEKKRYIDSESTSQETTNQTQPSPSKGEKSSFESFLCQPVNSLNLNFFRAAFGFLMSYHQFRALFWQGVIDANFFFAEINFHYFFARGIPTLPAAHLQTVFLISAISAFCMGIGLYYRASCATFLVTYTYLNLLEKTRYNNHYYLYILITLFFLITDAHKRLSVDSILSRRSSTNMTQESELDPRVPYWNILIFRFQLFIVYFYSGLAKLNYDWSIRFEPMTIWSSGERFATFRKAANLVLPESEVLSYLGCFFSVGGLFFDLFVGFFLLSSTLRPLGFFITFFFHFSNHFLFRIGTFPWVMMASNALFLNPDTLSDFLKSACKKVKGIFTLSTTRKARDSSSLEHKKEQKPSPRMSKPLKGFLMTYFVIQLLTPFRHWLYPGNVNWTMEGHQFSWRMMLNEEAVIMRLDVQTKTRNYTFDLNQMRIVFRQAKRMVSDPELVLQLVQYVKKKYVKEPDAVFKLDMWRGLNGRPYQRYVNKTVNMAAVNQNAFSYDWIMPQMSDDVIDFKKMYKIQRKWKKEEHNVVFFMESAGQEHRVFMKPYYCHKVQIFSLNVPIDFIVRSKRTKLHPRESVTVPSNAMHFIVTNDHAPSIWYYVFDCHLALFLESLRYFSDDGIKYSKFS